MSNARIPMLDPKTGITHWIEITPSTVAPSAMDIDLRAFLECELRMVCSQAIKCANLCYESMNLQEISLVTASRG